MKYGDYYKKEGDKFKLCKKEEKIGIEVFIGFGIISILILLYKINKLEELRFFRPAASELIKLIKWQLEIK
jgi:hypothetical protein